MARLCTEFETKVMVPDWKYCNEHRKEEPNRIQDDHCNFVEKYSGAYYCRLFGGMSLYSHEHRVLKCEECLKACESVING